jgi:hypothetical protein
VEGKVEGLNNKAYSGAIYFDLKGSSLKIKVKCPQEYNVRNGEYLIISGIPSLRTSRLK